MSATRTAAPSTSRALGALRAFQALNALVVLNVLFQYLTAGQLFPRGGPEELHSGGAVVLHVLSALATVAGVLLWRSGGASVRPAVWAAVVLVLGIVQAAVGGRDTLWVHVPGAMVLTVAAVWLLAWSVSGAARTAAADR